VSDRDASTDVRTRVMHYRHGSCYTCHIESLSVGRLRRSREPCEDSTVYRWREAFCIVSPAPLTCGSRLDAQGERRTSSGTSE
jgi:hypothetical protein